MGVAHYSRRNGSGAADSTLLQEKFKNPVWATAYSGFCSPITDEPIAIVIISFSTYIKTPILEQRVAYFYVNRKYLAFCIFLLLNTDLQLSYVNQH